MGAEACHWLRSRLSGGDVSKNQDLSVAKAKKAIAAYKKAVGQPEGLAELMVFFCERARASAATSACRTRAASKP